MKQSNKSWVARKIRLEAEVERGLAKWRNELSNFFNELNNATPNAEVNEYVAQAYTHESLATALDRLADRIEQS